MASEQSEARRALRELTALLEEIDERYLGDEWSAAAFGDLPDGYRSVANTLEGALFLAFDSDPERPFFRQIVSRTRKMLGDNPDALYYTAPVRGDRAYRVTGNTAGAAYLSFTVETASQGGGYSAATAGVLRDRDFDIAADGSFEVFFGGAHRARNWLGLDAAASELIVRCYFEEPEPVAADPTRVVPLRIEPVEPVGPPAPWDDASVAAAWRRVATFLRSRTLEQPKPGEREQPSWVSTTPNVFPPPELPGNFAFAAADAAYSMAPYVLGTDEALVVTGRWPTCAFANVSIWNRYLQTYDYAHRPVSRNRASTALEPDGSFRMVIAHADPGVPNWIDTEGRSFGMVFWRFFLPEGDIETPQATVVPLAEVGG
ncbi:MAG: hypothetical protein MUF83_15660 [Acidimicrobiales bacterium]|jgi:hypothetical protein|nr:hypothetical protein [Acidimicrobiales bacterium]